MTTGKGGWSDSKLIARAILHDRVARRKVVSGILMVALGMIAAGLWWLDGWLDDSLLLFAAWWGAVAVLTLLVMLFALYDALAVVREERDKHP